jgi:hypothetical protein
MARGFLRVAENNRPIVKTECGSDELENVILFFVRTDFAGRVKAQQQIETWQATVSGGPSRQP